jgi:hypothetical protein
MDRQIPSSAFLHIGQGLIIIEEPKAFVIREPLYVNVIDDDVSAYDILREWASILVEYFGELA